MINVELSNIWSCVSLPDLLSREKELFDAHLHLRSNKPGFPQYLGWLGQPDSLTARSLHAIRSAADAIRANADTLVVLGSCSAIQAAKAGLSLLLGPTRLRQGRPQILLPGTAFPGASGSICASGWRERASACCWSRRWARRWKRRSPRARCAG